MQLINSKKLELLPDWHPFLKYKQKFINDDLSKYADIANLMFECMLRHNGIGLAANQVGLAINMFIMDVINPRIIFNPKILSFEGKIFIEEGCLSFPNKKINIERSASIEVEYQKLDNKKINETLYGLEARCFLHEYDHLNGIVFTKYE